MELGKLVFLHFEKAAAAAFGIWLLAGGGPIVSPPSGVGESAGMRSQLEAVETHMTTEVPRVRVADATAALRRQLAAPEGRPGELGEWICHRRPSLVVGFEKREPEKPRVALHEAPSDLKAEPSHGKVALSWKHATGNAFVRITRYEVWRKLGAGEWEKLTEVSPETTRYVDTGVKWSRSELVYRITDHVAVDPGEEPGPVTPPSQTQLSVDSGGVSLPRDLHVTLVEATPSDPVAGVRGKAQLKVWKWNDATGKFDSRNLWSVSLGDSIGDTRAVLSRVSAEGVPGKVQPAGVIELRWPDGSTDTVREGVLPPEIEQQLHPRR